MKRKILFLCFIIALAVTACQPDDPATPSRKSTLSRVWQSDEVLVNGQQDSDPFWTSLSMDMKSNNTYTMSSSLSPSTGVWELSADESTVILDKGTSSEKNWSIDELNSSIWKTSFSNNGENIQITFRPK